MTGSTWCRTSTTPPSPTAPRPSGFAGGVFNPTPDLAQGLSTPPRMLRLHRHPARPAGRHLFLISVVAFLLVHLLPGDPTLAILGPNDTPAARAELLHQLGLNKGLLVQYGPGSRTSSTATWASRS